MDFVPAVLPTPSALTETELSETAVAKAVYTLYGQRIYTPVNQLPKEIYIWLYTGGKSRKIIVK
jgi:hypothetical protein